MSVPHLAALLPTVPHEPGVYLMKDRLGSIIYVGKAKDLRKRLAQYFNPSAKTRVNIKTRALIDSIQNFETHTVRNETEALVLEAKLIKDYRPRYNISLKDDKNFYLIRIQNSEDFPRLQLVRLRKNDGASYFGPFPDSQSARASAEWLQRKFGLRPCRPLTLKPDHYTHCHDDLIRNCSAPCIAKISHDEYHQRINQVCRILQGKGSRTLFDELNDEMHAAAESLDFEKAANLRDIIHALKRTLTPSRQFAKGRGLPTTVRPTEDLADLANFLGLPEPPRIMECFDISNVSSTHIVASMVRFTNGKPDNQNYRRYRIRTVAGQNDFASIAEVIRRRYSRILRENSQKNPEIAEHSQESTLDTQRRLSRENLAAIHLPDLVIVDGGKGQLSSAFTELKAIGLAQLPLIGLAKQREEVFFPGDPLPLLIPHDQGALKLLQRIRDEAHRFANSYNSLLLQRRMRESLLDDCPGVTPRRKTTLLKHFQTITKIRQATPAQLAALPGISLATAQAILQTLNREKS